MRIYLGGREKLVDLEARLQPTDGSKAGGKVVYKRYADGGELLRVRVHRMEGVPKESEAELHAGGAPVIRIRLLRGWGKAELTEDAGGHLPRLEVGHRVEVRSEGSVRLTGVMAPD